MRDALRARRKMAGVTLVELMIVVVVIGILAAIAYPSFQEQVRKTKRADGKAALMETAQVLERCYTRFANYGASACDAQVNLPRDSDDEHYRITGARNASSFALTATPQGDQANDSCGALTLDEAGIEGAAGDPDECW